MGTFALLRTGLFGSTSGFLRAESVLAATVLVLGVALVVARVTRASSSRRRREARGREDGIAPRHGIPARITAPGPRNGRPRRLRGTAGQPLSPSFTASRSTHGARGVRAGPSGPAPRPACAGAPARTAPTRPPTVASTHAPAGAGRPAPPLPSMAEPPVPEPAAPVVARVTDRPVPPPD